MKSVGVGSGVTGRGANLLILDDPVKSAAEAESKVYREATWNWYTHDAYTRLEDNGAVVLVMTRWHVDDLAGRLLQRMETGEGEPWEVLHLPAIDGEGRALWPEKYPVEVLENIRRNDIRAFEALYQGNPRPPEGAMFQRQWFTIVDAVPAKARRVRWWDKAATQAGGDYTVGALLAKDDEGVFWIEDIVRGQWATGARDKVIVQTAELDRQTYGNSVVMWSEQEPGSGGADAALAFRRMLAGYPVCTEPATGSKEVAAQPFASQAEAGNVRMLRARWNGELLAELEDFPLGAHDDQVDACSRAFNKLAAHRPYGGIHV